MRLTLLLGILALACSGAASALDRSSEGRYAIVHRDGQTTDKVFRVRAADGAWRLEDKRPDGSWVDVTCESGCELRDSTPADVKGFFSSAELDALARLSAEP